MNELVEKENIKDMIYEIRGMQVMLDSDVAFLYGVETKRINEAVKNNKERFPDNFCFKLTEDEFYCLRSKISTLNDNIKRGGRRYLPYVFTEQGIAMLSGIIKNKTAVKVSINIINAFVEMRHFIANHNNLFNRMNVVESKLLQCDNKINLILDKMHNSEFAEQLFFDGQIYDAYSLLINIIREAKKKIIIIDNYFDKTILDILAYKDDNIEAEIYVKDIKTKLDLDKFNLQYSNTTIKVIKNFHDRFIIIDDNILYHIGASLKDLGKKCFAVSKLDKVYISNILSKL